VPYQAYVHGATDGRLLDAPVYSIRENDESLEFTCHFQAWDDGEPPFFLFFQDWSFF
jgi:hypothetical protein